MILDAGQRAVLANVGFFLCRSGKVDQAERIFTGLAASDPDKDGAVIGMALCAIVNGDADGAADMLMARLNRGDSPIAEHLMLYRLVALGMAGRMNDAEKCREEMREQAMDRSLMKADLLLAELGKLEPDARGGKDT